MHLPTLRGRSANRIQPSLSHVSCTSLHVSPNYQLIRYLPPPAYLSCTLNHYSHHVFFKGFTHPRVVLTNACRTMSSVLASHSSTFWILQDQSSVPKIARPRGAINEVLAVEAMIQIPTFYFYYYLPKECLIIIPRFIFGISKKAFLDKYSNPEPFLYSV